MMNWKIGVGIALVSWPIVFLFIQAFISLGWPDFLKVIGGIIVVLGSIIAGAWVITKEYEDI